MAATVEICESNGSTETVTHNITNSNMGNVDQANLDPVANPIFPGANTFEKAQRYHVTNMGGSSKIDNLKVWRTGALGGSAVHLTNARTASYTAKTTYTQPVNTESSIAVVTMPTSTPSTANLGIGGSLSGSFTNTGYSDYLYHQIQSDPSDTSGSTTTLNYQYDEVA